MLVDRETIPLLPRAEACIPCRTRANPPLAAFEAAVLARVDGVRTVAEIAGLLSLAVQEVLHVLVRLESLGAVSLNGVDEDWDRPSLHATHPEICPGIVLD